MENQNELEIDLLDLLYYLKKKLAIIVAVVTVCAVIGMCFTMFFMAPEYTATTRMYVLNRSSDKVISSSDYSVSNYMVNDYSVLITGKNVTQKVIHDLGLNMTISQLASKISVSSINNTRVLQIKVVDTDPQRAAAIANAVRETASAQIKEIMAVDAVNLVYEAEVPNVKSGPSLVKNTVLAAMLGMVAVIGVLVVIYILDDTIRTEEDVERYLGLSVLGILPQSAEISNMAKVADTGGKRVKKKSSGKRQA